MNKAQACFISNQRIAHLASTNKCNVPHVVPICFVLKEGIIYSALDSKPKQVKPRHLRRVRNISVNPTVSLVFDRYSEDWSQLGYVLVTGQGSLICQGDERSKAEMALRNKYAQYSEFLQDGCPVIRIKPSRVVSWGNLDAPQVSRIDCTDSQL